MNFIACGPGGPTAHRCSDCQGRPVHHAAHLQTGLSCCPPSTFGQETPCIAVVYCAHDVIGPSPVGRGLCDLALQLFQNAAHCFLHIHPATCMRRSQHTILALTLLISELS